jgi:hypothetical protein
VKPWFGSHNVLLQDLTLIHLVLCLPCPLCLPPDMVQTAQQAAFDCNSSVRDMLRTDSRIDREIPVYPGRRTERNLEYVLDVQVDFPSNGVLRLPCSVARVGRSRLNS